jgi:hypothetical protein
MSQPSFTRNDLAVDLAARLNCSVESAKTTVEHVIGARSALWRGRKSNFADLESSKLSSENRRSVAIQKTLLEERIQFRHALWSSSGPERNWTRP